MRKNILIFGHGYGDGFILANNQYIELFDKQKYAVTVVYLDGKENEQVRKSHPAVEVIFLDASQKAKRGLKLAVIQKMLRLHRDKNFQIVICQRYKPTYVMLWVAQLHKIPLFFSVMHEMGALSHFSRKILVALLAPKQMILAGVSNALRDNLRRDVLRVPSDKIMTLYNMIDIEKTEPEILSRAAARQQLGLVENSFIFGILGRLVKAKDHQTLIKAFALVKPQCPHAKLVIMGDGELEGALRVQIQDSGLEKDIVLTGYLEKASGLLKAFDVFVLSSVKEAFGRVLLEAMVAKVPIIATNTHGIPEVMGDTGVLTGVSDPAQLSEKMLTFYNMPKKELIEWGERGYQRALSTFSLQRFKEIFWGLPLLRPFL